MIMQYKKFQKDFSYPQTGAPNTMFLTIIRCASELEFEEGADIKSNPGCIKSFIKEVQSSLKQLGYQPGGVDGQPGKKTLTAIKNFQADSGYLENGILNRETLTQLQEELKENGIKIL